MLKSNYTTLIKLNPDLIQPTNAHRYKQQFGAHCKSTF